jgi:hypothetical protein
MNSLIIIEDMPIDKEPHSNYCLEIHQLPILQSFEHTKFLDIEDKMKTLIQNQEEALAAHELAQM